MKFLADENVDKPIVDHLRNDGHEVIYVIEIEQGISDDEVIQRANREKALLLTADKDFGELFFRQDYILTGVLLIRLSGLSPQHKAEIVTMAVQRYGNELLQNFTVITDKTIRIRKRR
ncbi:DUF5615 family PIN-like protein [bacterium]|nr:DUF5615 family PIN-like protein [bacterium]MBU2461522.1 DUF5615 family PIN-like protein [bacterium]